MSSWPSHKIGRNRQRRKEMVQNRPTTQPPLVISPRFMASCVIAAVICGWTPTQWVKRRSRFTCRWEQR